MPKSAFTPQGKIILSFELQSISVLMNQNLIQAVFYAFYHPPVLTGSAMYVPGKSHCSSQPLDEGVLKRRQTLALLWLRRMLPEWGQNQLFCETKLFE